MGYNEEGGRAFWEVISHEKGTLKTGIFFWGGEEEGTGSYYVSIAGLELTEI